MTNTPRTLFQKVWDAHVAHEAPGEPSLLYIDLHLVHEVTSPQAFDGLRLAGRGVRRPDLTLATIDHGVPTANRSLGIRDPLSKKQIDALIANCEQYGITLYGLDDPRQGIVHIIGPEQGITQPGIHADVAVWSSDGSMIAARSGDVIFTIRRDGTDVRVLTGERPEE